MFTKEQSKQIKKFKSNARYSKFGGSFNISFTKQDVMVGFAVVGYPDFKYLIENNFGTIPVEERLELYRLLLYICSELHKALKNLNMKLYLMFRAYASNIAGRYNKLTNKKKRNY